MAKKTNGISSFKFKNIGVIRSGHTVQDKTPIQPIFAEGCEGHAEIFPEFAEGLDDVDGFSHIYLVYVLDRAGTARLKVKPFLQDIERGIFATRAPCRPNPIGLSIVRLIHREGNILVFDGADILDGTPLLDIKPYTRKFDFVETTKNGWQDEVDDKTALGKEKRGYGV
jgi:tRNA-Thr(GGU) m(6)t(6)A37 methyltransferase TsaA